MRVNTRYINSIRGTSSKRYRRCTSGGVYVRYLVFTRMPGESYCKRLGSLYLCYVFRALIISLALCVRFSAQFAVHTSHITHTPFSTICIFTHTLLHHSHISHVQFYGFHRHPSTECIFRDTLLQNLHFTDSLLSAKLFSLFFSFFFLQAPFHGIRVSLTTFSTNHFI